MIAVIGGTGLLGSLVAKAMAQAGLRVRIVSRHVAAHPFRGWPQIEGEKADVLGAADLARALEGCRSVHVSLSGGAAPAEALAVEAAAMRHLVRIGRQSRWTSLTLQSSSIQERLNSSHPAALAKAEAENLLQQSGLPYCIVRSSRVMESLVRLVRQGKPTLLGSGETPFHWVAGGDLAQLIAQAHWDARLMHRIVYAYGPHALSTRQALGSYAEAMGLPTPTPSAPFWLHRLRSRLVGNPAEGRLAAWMRALEKAGEPTRPVNGFQVIGLPPMSLGQWLKLEKAFSQPQILPELAFA